MYKYNKGQETIMTLREWREIFEYIDKVGMDKFVDFAAKVDEHALYYLEDIVREINNKESKLMKFISDDKDIIDFLMKRNIDLAAKGHAYRGKDSLNSFLAQLIKEQMTPNYCIKTLEELEKRGIETAVKSVVSRGKSLGAAIYRDNNKFVRYFSDQVIKASWVEPTVSSEFFYDISFAPDYHWYIDSTDYFNPQGRLRSIDLDSFKIDFDEFPTREEIDDLKFNPETKKGYQIIKSRP